MPATPARLERDAKEVENKRIDARKVNEDKYTEFYMGCENGLVTGCNSLGEWYSIMRGDSRSAFKYFFPACMEKKYAQSCYNLGSLLSQGSKDVPLNIPGAVNAFRIGCMEGSNDSCAEGAKLILSEVNNKVDVESTARSSDPNYKFSAKTAESMLKSCCDSGESVSNAKCCSMLAGLYMSSKFNVSPPSINDIVPCLEKGCKGEQSLACRRLASLYLNGNESLRIQKDLDVARLYEKQGLTWAGFGEKAIEERLSSMS